MIERTKIPDAAQQRATVSRVDICIVGEISPLGFLYASLPNLSSRLVGIPPGNLSRLAAKPNDRLIIYLCAYEGWTRCAASREEALTLLWGGGEALPIKEVRRDNFRICSRAPDTRRREM